MRRSRLVAVIAGAVILVAGGAFALGQATGPVSGIDFATGKRATPPPGARQVISNIPPDVANPFIANGVSVGSDVAVYNSSGTGPSVLNPTAPAGSPERYIDATAFPGAVLPPGVTITEAQGLNALARISDNLASVGLAPDDVISMRVFLDNPPDAAIADFAGFNRAFRQYYSNVDLLTGATLDVPLGTAAPVPPLLSNPVRPSRTALEVATLPVAGWLVEIEVVAKFPSGVKRWWQWR